MFIRGETLSTHSADSRKIIGWIVVAHENFSVNKQLRVIENKQLNSIKLVFCLFSFLNIVFDFIGTEENLVVVNNRVFMSKNYWSDSCSL